jgi:hypothetical protein
MWTNKTFVMLIPGLLSTFVICAPVRTSLGQQSSQAARSGVQVSGLPQPLAPDLEARAQQAASSALLRFVPLVASTRDGKLGFTSPDELKSATPGVPLQIAFVGLHQLETYTSAKTAASIILPSSGQVVPIAVAGEVRSAIFLKIQGADLVVVGFGQATMTKSIVETADMDSRSHGIPIEALTVIRIPALYQTFIARHNGTTIALTPIMDAPPYGFRRGEEISAEEVFLRLQPSARSYRPSSPAAPR